MRFDFTKGLNQKFSLSHRLLHGYSTTLLQSLVLCFCYFLFHSMFPGCFYLVLIDFLVSFFVSVMMGPTEIPTQSSEIIKIPISNYEFGANFIDPKVPQLQYFFLIIACLLDLTMEVSFVFLAVNAFGEGRDRWEVKCEAEVWFDWKSYSQGKLSSRHTTFIQLLLMFWNLQLRLSYILIICLKHIL